jgi:vitamin B12 transporter
MNKKAIRSLLLASSLLTSLAAPPPARAQELQDEGVTVEASPPPETTAKRVVSKEDIEKSAARDLAELLQDTLNLETLSYGGYGASASVNLRGFDAQRVAFLIDGVSANSPVTGGFDFSALPIESIESVEVVEGGSDASFNASGALGGVVNIITAKKQAPGLRVNASLFNTSYLPTPFIDDNDSAAPRQWQDLADAQRAALSAGFGSGAHSLSANLFATRAANRFPFRDHDDIVRRKTNSEVQDLGISASYTRDLAYYASTSFKTNAYFANKNVPRSGYSHDFDEQQTLSLSGTALLDAPRAFSDQWAADLTLNYRFSNSVFAGDGQSLHHIQAVTRWTWSPAERFTLKTGADYSFAELLAHNAETRFTSDAGVYLTAYIQPNPVFLVAPSLKAVFRNASVVPVPKLGLLWLITEDLSLRNNYYRSFKHPDMEDLYWDDGLMTGDPDLKSEDGWGGDIALSFRKASFTIDGSLFAQWTRDSIHWYPSGAAWKPQNAGEAVFWGCKAEANASLPVPFVLQPVFKAAKLSLSYQLLESRLLTDSTVGEKRIPYAPTHVAVLAIEGAWGAGLIRVSGRFESSRFADVANAKELARFFLLNLNVSQKLGDLTLFCAVRNALNVSYQTFVDYPMPGISGTLGIKVQKD